jgi:ABC-type transport system substrate-binding protein
MLASGRAPIAMLMLLVMMGACAPPPTSREQTGTAPSHPTAAPARTLVASVRVEPSSVSWRPFREAGVALFLTRKMFNAELGYRDEQALSQPYLAEEFPSLNSDGWRVFPDGRMETTYRLKAGLTWHDGTPLTAVMTTFQRLAASLRLANAGTP